MLKEYFEKFGEIIEVVRVMLCCCFSTPGCSGFDADMIPSVHIYRSLCEIE